MAPRQCHIKISNNCSDYSLIYPRDYIDSGYCAEPLPTSLEPSASGTALFKKKPDVACGAVGVFTYDLVSKTKKVATQKIAVMFHAPFDYFLYNNWYAVGIFDQNKQCDYDLYDQMLEGRVNQSVRRKAKDGNNLIYKSNGVTIIATMSDSDQPEIKVEVRD